MKPRIPQIIGVFLVWLAVATIIGLFVFAVVTGYMATTLERTEDRCVDHVGVSIANVYETPEGELYVRMHDYFGGERGDIPTRDWAAPWAIQTLQERLHKCSDLIDAVEPREVDTLLWQFDASRGIAVRVPIEESGVWHVVQVDGFEDWRIRSIELMEGPPGRPKRFQSVMGVTDPEYEIAHDFLVRSDDIEAGKTYSLQARLHSDNCGDVEKMVRLLRAGGGVLFVKVPK